MEFMRDGVTPEELVEGMGSETKEVQAKKRGVLLGNNLL
jgi:hypothetical protein